MTSDRYENPMVQPPADEWIATIHSLRDSDLQKLRASARRRLVVESRRYSEHLWSIASEQPGDCTALELFDGSADLLPVVMTGHQPVVFHSGLTYKYEVVEEFTQRSGSIGIALVIDTDEGDAGEFAYPSEIPTEVDERMSIDGKSICCLQASTCSFATAPAMHGNSRLRAVPELREFIDHVRFSLLATRCRSAAQYWMRVASVYEQVRTPSMMEANLVVRRRAGIGGRLMEMRLSEICGFPEVIQFFGRVLAKAISFAQTYNESLERFRSEHRIRNAANPFPSLSVSDSETELPFWIVDLSRGHRTIPVVRRVNGVPTLQTSTGVSMELIPGHESAAVFSLLIGRTPLVPRGALITATMRLLFCDLFVHGTGGGRYDQFTTEFIRTWWMEDPTPIAVASASRYLFAEERRELTHLESLASQLRDLQFNPQRYFGRMVFSDSLEFELRGLLSEKDAAVALLKQARIAGTSAEDLGQTIQRLSDRIRQRVSEEFAPQIAKLKAMPPSSVETIRNRTWPWFFFATPAAL